MKGGGKEVRRKGEGREEKEGGRIEDRGRQASSGRKHFFQS